jgi:DNA-binding transcriptional regulator YdaS (Cro superfamily)
MEQNAAKKFSPARKAVRLAGGPSALSRQLGITPQAISRWLARDTVPANWVLSIEELLDGEISRHDLRPDVFGYQP